MDLIKDNGVTTHGQLSDFIKEIEGKSSLDYINYEEFDRLILGHSFIKRVYESQLVIPEWRAFKQEFENAFREIKEDPAFDAGENADYIDTLKNADPKKFASSFCSIDGQYT